MIRFRVVHDTRVQSAEWKGLFGSGGIIAGFLYKKCQGFLFSRTSRARMVPSAKLRAYADPTKTATTYRGTSLMRNSAPLGPYSRKMPRALWWS